MVNNHESTKSSPTYAETVFANDGTYVAFGYDCDSLQYGLGRGGINMRNFFVERT